MAILALNCGSSSVKFGLFEVDFSNPAKVRTPTAAVPAYQQLARNLGLSPAP